MKSATIYGLSRLTTRLFQIAFNISDSLTVKHAKIRLIYFNYKADIPLSNKQTKQTNKQTM